MAESDELTAERVEKILICANAPSDHSDPMLSVAMKAMRDLCASHESLRRDAERYRKLKAAVPTESGAWCIAWLWKRSEKWARVPQDFDLDAAIDNLT